MLFCDACLFLVVWSRTRGVSDMCPHLINGVTAGCRDRGKFCLLFVLSGFSKCSPTKRKLWSCGGRRWGGAEECQGGLGVTSYGVIGTGMPSDGPIHRWAVSVGEQVCLQGPGVTLHPLILLHSLLSAPSPFSLCSSAPFLVPLPPPLSVLHYPLSVLLSLQLQGTGMETNQTFPKMLI